MREDHSVWQGTIFSSKNGAEINAVQSFLFPSLKAGKCYKCWVQVNVLTWLVNYPTAVHILWPVYKQGHSNTPFVDATLAVAHSSVVTRAIILTLRDVWPVIAQKDDNRIVSQL